MMQLRLHCNLRIREYLGKCGARNAQSKFHCLFMSHTVKNLLAKHYSSINAILVGFVSQMPILLVFIS